MKTSVAIGLMLAAGCGQDVLSGDCSDPLASGPAVATFADVDVFTECYSVVVCENGDFDWSDSLSEQWSAYQFDAQGQTTFIQTFNDGDDGTPCSMGRSFGSERAGCTDRRLARGCVIPDAPREALDEPLEILADVPSTLEQARAVGVCSAVATCEDSNGVELEAWVHDLPTELWFVRPVAARSTVAVYELGSGSLRTSAHLTGPSVFAFESETGGLYWDGPPELACLDAEFTLSIGCQATLGVPEAIELARIGG